jgi:uncharacterized membrane protein YeaQ/YmgE (transglycosylase-associated protein family)
MVWYILGLLFLGLIAGAIARLFISSPSRLGCLGTALLGVVGSYAGGSLGAVIFDDKFDLRKASTFIGAIVGSMLVLGVWRLIAGARTRR